MSSRVYSWLTHALALSLLICVVQPSAMGQANLQGQWSTLSNSMPINPVHVALLSNGKLLVVAGSGNCPPSQSGCPSGPPYSSSNGSGALLLDPVSGQTISQFSLSWDMFCNGMVLLEDGRPFVVGGTVQYDPFYGQPQAATFDPLANTFSNTPNMAHGRWYPTVVTLGDGRVMAFSGLTETGGTNTTAEFYTDGSGWSTQVMAFWTPDLYPRLHVLPNGKVFYSGAQTTSKLFDPSTNAWNTNVATTKYSGTRTYGTSVLLPLSPSNNYDPKVMIMGGGNPATATTEIIDMGAATPAWQLGPNMSQARIEMNAVILPNGKVLAVGGSVNDEDTNTVSLNADLYDPVSNTFSSAGANAFPRLYHSVALLLPDATVWLAGGNPSRGRYVQQMEIYKPAYLFNPDGTMATRPSITSAPSTINYGEAFTVATPDAANISSAVLVRNGTVTHAFGMDQREVGLSFTAGSGILTITAPPNGNIAPPGYYMLFLLNQSGVPSVASFVQVTAGPPDFSVTAAPSSQNVSPGKGTNYTVNVTPSNGFIGNVSFSVTGLPSGTTASFTPSSVSDSGSSTLAVNTSTSTPIGNYTLTITATSGALTHSTQVSLAVANVLPISFAQVASATPQSPTATVSVSYPAAQTLGDLNVVVVGWNDTTATVQLVKDSAGNTYSPAIGPTSGTALRQSIYYAANIVGGSNTVTVTFNQAAAFPDIRILEYRGVTTLDVTAGASGSSTTPSSGAATTTSANELIFGADIVATTTVSAGSGFTSRIITSQDGDIAEDKAVTTSGSNSATATLNTSGPWVMQMVTFSAASGPAPTVTGVSPNSGSTAGGTAVTITGTNFASGATVKFGSASATNVVVVNSTTITATTPAGSAGATTVTVTSGGQSGSLTSGFNYVAPPTVTSISPSSGTAAGGTAVTITGTNFASGATVKFGNTSATNVVVVNSTSITATTPAGSAGAVTVTVTNSNGQSGSLSNGYTYVGTPTVTSVSPNSGSTSGGTAVTITGTNFAAGATVTFGSSAATNVVVVNSTTITATTPAGSAGAVTVTVTNSSGQSGSQTNGFTYVVSPTVSSVSPNSGPVTGGTAVTITGTNFVAGATAKFGSNAATNVVVVNSTTITATTPAGSAGAVTVTVTSSGGLSGSQTNGFTYIGTPTVTSVSPNSGSTSGGTAVTITGTNFAAGATVKFGSNSATNVAVVNSTAITATTPAGSAGAVTVTVTNSGGQSGSLTNGFTYNTSVAIGFAQVAAATPQSAMTVNVSYPAAQTLGDLNIVVVGWNDTTSTVQSVKDSAGNTYNLAIGPTTGTGLRQSIYYAPNIKSGSNTVTVTFSQAAAFPDIRILEYRGVTALDVKAGASGSGTSASSGAATTTSANELIVGADTIANTTVAAGSGFTARIITSPDSDLVEDKVVTTAGSNSATATFTPGAWVMQMVTFK